MGVGIRLRLRVEASGRDGVVRMGVGGADGSGCRLTVSIPRGCFALELARGAASFGATRAAGRGLGGAAVISRSTSRSTHTSSHTWGEGESERVGV